MKRILKSAALCTALAALLLCGGCIRIGVDGIGVTLIGAPEEIEEHFSLGSGCRVELDNMSFHGTAGVSIRILYGSETKVEGSVPQDIFDHGFSVTASNGVLRIAPRKHLNIRAEHFELTVTAPFDEVILSGAYPVAIDAAGAGTVTLEVNGAASGTVENLTAEKLAAEFSGAGAFAFGGTAAEAEFTVKGAGAVDAAGLVVKALRAKISGAGDMVISVTDTLNAQIDGVGSIEYYGRPQVSQKIGGIGSVTQRAAELPGE